MANPSIAFEQNGGASLAGGNHAHSNHAQANNRQVAAELHQLARDARRIGTGWRDDPETIALQKERLANRLACIARRLEGKP